MSAGRTKRRKWKMWAAISKQLRGLSVRSNPGNLPSDRVLWSEPFRVEVRELPKRQLSGRVSDRYETFGYALAMRVLQSPTYARLDDKERAECDELIKRGQAAPKEDRHGR